MTPFLNSLQFDLQGRGFRNDSEGASDQYLTQSFDLDGTNDNIRTAGTTFNRLGSGDASFGGWFKAASIPGSSGMLMTKYSSQAGAQEHYVQLRDTTGYLRVTVWQTVSTGKVYDYQTNVCDNVWHHFAATFDQAAGASVLKVYVDGSEVSVSKVQDNAMSNLQFSFGTFKLGASGDTSDNPINFLACQVAGIFGADYLLSAADVTELQGDGVGKRLRPSQASFAANLVYSYEMFGDDDGTDSTGVVRNRSDGAGQDMTPYNTVAGDITTDIP